MLSGGLPEKLGDAPRPEYRDNERGVDWGADFKGKTLGEGNTRVLEGRHGKSTQSTPDFLLTAYFKPLTALTLGRLEPYLEPASQEL